MNGATVYKTVHVRNAARVIFGSRIAAELGQLARVVEVKAKRRPLHLVTKWLVAHVGATIFAMSGIRHRVMSST